MTVRATLATALAMTVAPATALDNGVGLLPPMGWGTWNLFGCWGYNWTEVDVRGMADALVSSGMKDAGYEYINLDGGWDSSRDPTTGAQIPNPAMFPSGMPALVDYVHSKGLKFGIYRDRHEGLGHEEADAKQYAEWKCDYVKNDGYGNSTPAYSHGMTATEVYGKFRDAINATGRPMVLNVKFDVEPEGFASAAEIANTWRVGRDIRPVWSDVVRLADIVEPLAHLSHPGGFSDLDSLEVGVAAPILVDAESGQPSNRCSNFCPSSGVLSGACVPAVPPRNVTMSLDEQRSQMALWCMTNSMLIAGNDLRTMSAETRDILVAKGPLSVLKDPLTVGARRMRLEPAGLFETWARPLHGGAFAALLWSRNESCLANDDSRVHLDPTPQIFWRSLGFRGSAEVVDLWTGESLGVHADHWPPSYSSPLKWGLRPHAHRLVKVLPRPDAEWTSEVGEARQWKCPAWGCQVQDTVLRQFAQRVSLKTEDEETAADDPWQKITANPDDERFTAGVMSYGTPPVDNPVLARYPESIIHGRESINAFSAAKFPWSNVVGVDAVASPSQLNADPAAAYAKAAAQVLEKHAGGGVVFFPAGTFTFAGSLKLVDGIVLRGAPAAGNATTQVHQGTAKPGPLSPTTRFVFPDRSYSQISCVNCSICGVVSIYSDGGAVELRRATSPMKGAASTADPMFLVLGNKIVNAVYKYPVAPPQTSSNEWPYRFSTAIAVAGDHNTLIANNLLAKTTRSTTVSVEFTGGHATKFTSHSLRHEAVAHPGENRVHTDSAKSCSSSITLHQKSVLDVAKDLSNARHARNGSWINATGDELTAGCCLRCLNDAYCIGFQAQQTFRDHYNCETYSCPTDKSPNCTLSVLPWVAPAKPSHNPKKKEDPPAVGVWTGTPRPKLPPKHPPHPPKPSPPPGPPSPPGPHPHPHPHPPAQNCSLKVPFPYDNRYGIWLSTTTPAAVTKDVIIADNYVHMNGRVGVIWTSNDGLGRLSGADVAPVLGSGVAVVRNHVETLGQTTCWSVDGSRMTHGSSTNENRGYDQQGTGSYVADNTGAVRRQRTTAGCAQGSYMTVDGEGILQQIQDGAVAERNIWTRNDLRPSEYGPIELYALHSVQDMIITDNWAGGTTNGGTSNIGIVGGGSTPKNGTGESNLRCSGNHPRAKCGPMGGGAAGLPSLNSLKTEDEETAAGDPWQKICEAEYAGHCPAGWDWLTKPDKSRGCADPPCCAPTPAHPKNSKCTTIQGMTASWKNHGQTGLKAKQAWEAYCGIFWPTPSCPSGWTSDSGNNRCEPPAKHPSDCKMITGVQGYDYFKKEAWQQTCTGEHWVCPNPGAKPPPHPHPSPGPPKPPANPNTDARKVFIVFGNHLDVGYASFSVDIINRYMNEFFPRAIATAAQFRANYPNGSRGYTWLGFSFILEFLHNCQSASSASKYFDQVKLQCPNATVTAGIEAAIRAGPTHGLSWHAMPHNAEPEMYDEEFFEAAINLTHKLDKHFGLPPRMTYSQRDVPGLSRAAVPVLSRLGIKAISVGENDCPRPLAFFDGDDTKLYPTKIFRWLDASSNASQITIMHPHGYGGITQNDCVYVNASRTALCTAWRGDNTGPHAFAEADGIFDQVQAEFPNASLQASDGFDDFVKTVLPVQHTLKTLTHEMGDSWIYGGSTDPVKVATYRAAMRVRKACRASGRWQDDGAPEEMFDRFLMKEYAPKQA